MGYSCNSTTDQHVGLDASCFLKVRVAARSSRWRRGGHARRNGTANADMFAAMAQFEREMMLERQREGIAKAKAEGKYKGRKPTARLKADDAVRLYRDRKRVACIAKELVSVGAACTGPLTRRACPLRDNAALLSST